MLKFLNILTLINFQIHNHTYIDIIHVIDIIIYSTIDSNLILNNINTPLYIVQWFSY